jgi:alginate O-acetyltransferase complex protein AlgJ
MKVARVGDLVEMLRLTPDQRIYPPQQVTLRQVVNQRTGEPWQAERGADVLLLGDSFANIYSNPSLGWGSGAGLAEHLAHQLRRPIDVIALNGGGASGTRQALAGADNRDRLDGKRVVVYQFSMRDLASEDWVPVSLPLRPVRTVEDAPTSVPSKAPPADSGTIASPSRPAGAPAPATTPATTPSAAAETLTIVGRVLKNSRVPEPHTAPYDDCVTFVLIQVENVESGSYADQQLLAVFWAMKDNEWLPAARYAPGDRLRLRLVLLRNASDDVRTAQRADDLDDYSHLPYFALSAEAP